MDNYNSRTVIKIEKEEDDLEEQFTGTWVNKTSQNNFEKAYESCLTSHSNPPKNIDYGAYNVGETCIETIVKVEVDLVNGHCFESVIEIEKNSHLFEQTKNYNLDEIQPFVCDVCKKSFSTKRRVARHITHSHSAHLSNQKITGKRVIKNAFVNKRTRNESNKKSNGCESSIESDNSKQTAPKYSNSTSQGLFQCYICQMSYTTKTQITLHITKSHKSSTNEHSPRRPKNISRPYKCEVCSKSFFTKVQLKIHDRVHTGEKPYSCDLCLKSFSVKCNLTKHKLVHTGEKPYKCVICLKSFSANSKLTRHQLVHTGDKPYECNVCLKSFSRKFALTLHERVHTGEKPYKCDICSKTFSRKGHVTQHKLIHTGVKPYKCNVCLRSFNQNSALTKHKRLHAVENPYKCDRCLKTFSQKHRLKKHKCHPPAWDT